GREHAVQDREADDVVFRPERRRGEKRHPNREEQDPGSRHHSYPLTPTSPVGLTSSKSSISRKPTISACCGPKTWAEKLSTRPSTSPPTSAPGTEPSPPMTQTMKALPR